MTCPFCQICTLQVKQCAHLEHKVLAHSAAIVLLKGAPSYYHQIYGWISYSSTAGSGPSKVLSTI